MNDVIERFLRHIRVNEETGCWEWIGANDSRWYGKFWLEGRSQRAHRVALALWKRRPRRGYPVLHACDYPPCVNPDHLSEGRQRSNVHDMMRKGRAWWQKAA